MKARDVFEFIGRHELLVKDYNSSSGRIRFWFLVGSSEYQVTNGEVIKYVGIDLVEAVSVFNEQAEIL